MSDILAQICAGKREEVSRRRKARPLNGLIAAAAKARPIRGFAAALAGAVAREGRALIAEIKKASPSRGLIRADFDPPALARAYLAGGASCLSVLTDGPYFQGDDSDLVAARDNVELPVLRKDFILDPYQVVESRVLGADCVLLIMAALDDSAAADIVATAKSLDLDVLVEVHDETELERGLALEASLIGVNNRDLKTLSVDLATTERLAPMVPRDRALVCESGLRRAADIERMIAVGARRFLVGESLMREIDVAGATATLLGRPVPAAVGP